jgi:hypothetical protein
LWGSQSWLQPAFSRLLEIGHLPGHYSLLDVVTDFEELPLTPHMAYILGNDIGEVETPEDFERQETNWRAYRKYLESVRERLPGSAFEFATALWRYDTVDARSLHDSWIDSLVISEPALGDLARSDRLKCRFDCLDRTMTGTRR